MTYLAPVPAHQAASQGELAAGWALTGRVGTNAIYCHRQEFMTRTLDARELIFSDAIS